jgi:hypothetical protein
MGAWLPAEPADDLHAAVGVDAIHEHLAAEVMVEVDLIPALGEAGQASRDVRYPDRPWMLLQE